MMRFFVVHIFIWTSTFGSDSSASAGSCSGDEILAPCERMKEAPFDLGQSQFGFPKSTDGSIIYNDAGKKDKGLKPFKPSADQLNRAVELTKSARDIMKDIVVGDTRPESLSPEQVQMTKLLSTLKIENGKTNDRSCKGYETDPNAFYDFLANKIVICPSAAVMDPAAFQMLIAHEVGHVVSPCNVERWTPSTKERASRQPGVFSSLSSCLSQNYNSNFEARKKTPGRGPRAKSVQCFGAFEEHFADAIGAKIFNHSLNRSSQKREMARAGLAQMHGLDCSSRSRSKDPGAGFNYPATSDRMNIQLSALQEAIGCEMPFHKTCTVDGGPRGSSTGGRQGGTK